LPCPRERNPDSPGTSRFVPGCPLTFSFPSSRTPMSAYVSPQWRPDKKLILDAGARVAVAPEALGVNHYDPTLTFAGTVVYNFIPNWHVKLNYSQGFRPPVFNNLNSNGEAVQLDGGELETETTDAYQGELNARIFKGDRRIRELNFRMDVSYTRVQNLIQIQSGRYQNAADRGIASVEFLGKLYIQGGHRIELGYTYMNMNTADKGEFRAMPEHWFNLLGVYNVSDDKLRAFTNLRVLGAMEDANRLVEHRNLHYCTQAEFENDVCALGDVLNESSVIVGYIRTLPTELVLDRIPASAELSLGMTYTPSQNLEITAEAFNALNGRYYQPDLFFDYEPRLEFLPNPREDVRVFVGANYKY
jgi:outer membrane receptor protein involved in Fe transport